MSREVYDSKDQMYLHEYPEGESNSDTRILKYLEQGMTVREAVNKARVRADLKEVIIERFERLWANQS